MFDRESRGGISEHEKTARFDARPSEAPIEEHSTPEDIRTEIEKERHWIELLSEEIQDPNPWASKTLSLEKVRGKMGKLKELERRLELVQVLEQRLLIKRSEPRPRPLREEASPKKRGRTLVG